MDRCRALRSKITTNVAILRERYVSFLLRFSWALIGSIFVVAIALSTYSIWRYKATFTFDPRIGFETRGTKLSDQRLAVQNLLEDAANNLELTSFRTKRSADINETDADSDITVDYDDYGVDPYPTQEDIRGACDQYFALGTFIPLNYIEYFAKVVFRVRSFDKLFTMESMQRLCYLDTLIDSTMKSSAASQSGIKRLPYSFKLPYYTMCSNPRIPSNSCESLDENEISKFRGLIMECLVDNAPAQCSTSVAKQLRNMIFQRNEGPFTGNDPLCIAAVLPITMSPDDSQDFHFYDSLLKELERYYNDDGDVKLVGASFNVKQSLFEHLILWDALLGVLAVSLVVVVIVLYSNSFLFTVIVSAALVLSVGVSFFIYTVIFGVTFFPFLNLLAIVLIVAVGADDAFLFLYQFRKHKQEMKSAPLFVPRNSDDFTISDDTAKERRRERVRSCLSEALSHAAVAMLVTSATTAVAFYANLASNIVVLRCFGIYAGTTMVINYLFVITILPATVVIIDDGRRHWSTSLSGRCFIRRYFARFREIFGNFVDKAFRSCVPRIVELLRWPFIPVALTAFAISLYAIIETPGIRLPRRNSMQLLRSSQPYEWFDEYAAELFDFSMGERIKMNLVAVWGIEPTTTASSLVPSEIGSLRTQPLFEQQLFNNLPYFESQLQLLSNYADPHSNSKLWLERFLDWTHSTSCSPVACCNLTSTQHSTQLATPNPLTSCFLHFSKAFPIPTFTDASLSATDGPVFDKNGYLIAYFLNRPTRFNFSTVFDEIKPFFEFVATAERLLKENPNEGLDAPIIQTSCSLTALYDLLERLLNGTAISVLISLLVSTAVLVLTTFQLTISITAIFSIAVIVALTLAIVLWCGWTINVVEATIIVLTIGLSFDYSLHVAVGFKLSDCNDYRSVSSTVGVPVLLASVSSFLAGVALIYASTQAFFEISVFLMLMTSLSAVVALFLLPSILTLLSSRSTRVLQITKL